MRLNLWKRRTRAIFISSWASLIPTQFRGPAPKGMYTNGWRLALASGVNLGNRVQSSHEVYLLSSNSLRLSSFSDLSGMNLSGSGQWSGSRWRKPAGISSDAPFGNDCPLTTQSHSTFLANLCAVKCNVLCTWITYNAELKLFFFNTWIQGDTSGEFHLSPCLNTSAPGRLYNQEIPKPKGNFDFVFVLT